MANDKKTNRLAIGPRLLSLSEGYILDLSSRTKADLSIEWTLSLNHGQLLYRGSDLVSLVARAWAGEPPDERRL